MKKNIISFVLGVASTVAVITAMGAQPAARRSPNYGDANYFIAAEIALYECKDAAGDAATQQARLARIKRYASVMDTQAP